MSAVCYSYDGSFDGLLTAVFYSYERGERAGALATVDEALWSLFGDELCEVATDAEKARRVWRGLEKKLSRGALGAVATAFLCADDGADMVIYRFICRFFDSQESVENDFSDADVVRLLKNCRKVRGEAHRLLQFVRFQKATDGTYFAMVEPLYDVLPLAVGHFRDRFSDSRFVIYDRARDYGYYYDGNELSRMSMKSDGQHMVTGRLSEDMADKEEALFQRLWRAYFHAVAIRERMNPRKQRQDMPVRYWKYLTEKQL